VLPDSFTASLRSRLGFEAAVRAATVRERQEKALSVN